jgi:hypothetical protein
VLGGLRYPAAAVADPPSTRDLRPGGTVAEDAAAPRPGELFAGRYLVDAELGRGGFGAVYAARDTLLDRPVALKVLTRGARDPETLARFLQEARSAAALASEHVVSVHDIVVGDDGAPFLVMELLRGADLHDELTDHGPMPVATAVDLVLQAALGLAHAHARGIVHRDLKPRNLFLARRADGTRVVKVLDFGMARWASSELTASGAAIGTPRYMAPEQLRSSRAVDARADVWSLGVVLYELVTGAPIVDADTPLQFAAQLLVDPHVPLQVRRPTLPDGLARVVDRCLAKDPAARFGDLAVFAAALAEFANDARALPARIAHVLGSGRGADLAPTVQRPGAAAATPGTAPVRRRRALVAGLLVSVAVVGAAGVALAARPQRSVGARCVGARGRGRRRRPGGVAGDRRPDRRRRRRPDRRAHRRPDRLAHRSDRRPNPSGRSTRAIRAAERRGRRDPRLVPQQRRRD